MGKTTKKKKSRRLKRRIGLIAIGGLSMVLTVCLSVGATLAWFAGSTWASKDLFMGGPVYVEMAGRGQAGNTNSDGSLNTTPGQKDYAEWKGGNGQLDIIASKRSTGTKDETWNSGDTAGKNDVLLPGQKMLVYSQARVYSTKYNSSVGVDDTGLSSSGANVNNSNYTYTDSKGEKKTTTTSVLRARFSINVEFDPTVGFNNFTDANYADHYPVQSANYTGQTDITDATEPKNGGLLGSAAGQSWWLALGAVQYNSSTTAAPGRRDAVTVAEYGTQYVGENATAADTTYAVTAANAQPAGDLDDFNDNTNLLWAIQKGITKSIYKWKYVSETQYKKADGTNGTYKMGAPFNGQFNTSGGNSAEVTGGSGVGFYGVWEVGASKAEPKESDAFYKVRTTEYLQSYKESYVDENDRKLVLTIQEEMKNLENALNKSFVKLVNESSEKIMEGLVNGFTATDEGVIANRTAAQNAALTKCSWLYVDPSIGNDINASDSATSTGGWWYLVDAGNTAAISTQNSQVVKQTDSVNPATVNAVTQTPTAGWSVTTSNTISTTDGTSGKEHFTREGKDGLSNSDEDDILNAKLYEITPSVSYSAGYTTNSNVEKIVSVAFPFVNGMFELPGKELTNIFANAKISFQISFQALQAFFPWSPSIDGLPSGHQLAGLGKALNIRNAIPIYNEAFNYLAYLSA